MKIENYLNQLKKDYESTNATEHLKQNGWSELEKRMVLTRPRKSFFFRFAFVSILIFAGIIGSYNIVSASMPNNFLYPVKLLSEKVIEKTSGSNEIVIDHRAQEIIGLSQEQKINKEALEKVSIEYKESVSRAKVDADLQRKLDKHHTEFDRIGRDNPEIQNEIKDAQDASDHGRD